MGKQQKDKKLNTMNLFDTYKATLSTQKNLEYALKLYNIIPPDFASQEEIIVKYNQLNTESVLAKSTLKNKFDIICVLYYKIGLKSDLLNDIRIKLKDKQEIILKQKSTEPLKMEFKDLKKLYDESFVNLDIDDALLIGAFIYKFSPRRDLMTLRIDLLSENDNYVDLKKKKIVYNKINKVGTKLEFDIPEKFLTLFKTKIGDKWLIYNKVENMEARNKLFSRKFEKLTKELFGEKMTSTYLRIIYENKDSELKTQTAKENGHTMNTANSHYKKNDNSYINDVINEYNNNENNEYRLVLIPKPTKFKESLDVVIVKCEKCKNKEKELVPLKVNKYERYETCLDCLFLNPI